MGRQASEDRNESQERGSRSPSPLRRRRGPSERKADERMDDTTRVYFSDPVVVADAFNYLLYSGNPVIKPESLTPLDPAEVFQPSVDGLPLEMRQKSVSLYRDAVKLLTCMDGEKASYAILGIEGQTNLDLGMVVRAYAYNAFRYAAQRRELMNRNNDNRVFDQKGNEKYRIGGLLPEDKLHPVITLVVYLSDKPWEGVLSLHDILDVKDKRLLQFVPDYRLPLLEPHRMEHDELMKFGSDLRGILFGAKYANDASALEANLPDFAPMLKPRTLPLLNNVTHCRFQINSFDQSTHHKPEDNMQNEVKTINVWQCALNEGKKQGRNEGFVDGCIEALLKLGVDENRILEMVMESKEADSVDAEYVRQRMKIKGGHRK